MSRFRVCLQIATLGFIVALSVLNAGCLLLSGKSYERAQGSMARGDQVQAIEQYQQAIRFKPSFAEAHYNLGAARFRLLQTRLKSLVNRHGTPALKRALAQLRASVTGRGTISAVPFAKGLKRELLKLPPARTAPLVALFQQAVKSRLRAHALFTEGRQVILSKAKVRAALIRLRQVVFLQKILGSSPSRGQLLLCVADLRLVIYVHLHPHP